MGACGDVKKHHFIGALGIVTNRQLNRITDVAKTAILCTPKLNPPGDLAIMNI